MINAVLFDLDGTLFDRDTSLPHYLAAQYGRFPSLAAMTLAEYVSRVLELDQHGHGGTFSVFERLLDERGIDSITAEDLESDYQAGFREHALPFVGLHALLNDLAAAGLRLGIVTNGSAMHQSATIQSLGIESHFETIVISGIEGVRKPEAEIFERAVRRLGTKAENAVFVGDHPTVDVAGAWAAGMFAIWKRTNYWSEPLEMDAAIDTLGELPALIGGLSRRRLR